MLHFPQLASGANGQFPALRRIVQRTILTEQADGRVVKNADPPAAAVEWTLTLAGLSTAEIGDLEMLFVSAEGRLRTFVFLDPMDNLLRWSEDPSAAAWIRDSGIEVGTSLVDPFGGTGAARITNTAQVELALRQTIEAPSRLRYCFSVYARSETAAGIALFAEAGPERIAKEITAAAAWKRFELAVELATDADALAFGVMLPAGAAVQVFGFQADAQRGASQYKRSTSRAGVYGEARFAEDLLGVTTEGPDSHSCTVKIWAPLGG